MNKNQYIIRIALLAALLPTLLFTSCRFEDDDYFSESPALRIEHEAEEVQNLLVSKSGADENGWVMQYFCGTEVAHFEGFNLFARFDDNEKVLMAGNHRMLRYGQKNKYTESASVYEMLQEDGLVLAFNTWNDVLTPFVDPVIYYPTDAQLTAGVLPKDGAGMAGDHNFVVMSHNGNEVILRGERWGAEVRLVACDRPWEDYIADAEKLKNYITSTTINSYYVTNGADTLYFVGLRNGRFRYCERVDDPLRIDSLACVFTPEGFRIEKENAIGDNHFHEFTLAADSTCLVSEDGNVKVIATWDNYIVNRTSLWKLDPSCFTPLQQELYSQIEAEVGAFASAYSLDGLCIGRSTGNNVVSGLVVRYFTNSRRTQTATAGIALNMQKPAFGQMLVELPEKITFDSNMENFNKRTNLGELVRQFAETLNGVYDIVPDNYFLPTGGTFTVVDGSSSFKLMN